MFNNLSQIDDIKFRSFFSLKKRQNINSLFLLLRGKKDVTNDIKIRDLDAFQVIKLNKDEFITLIALSFIQEEHISSAINNVLESINGLAEIEYDFFLNDENIEKEEIYMELLKRANI